jgi:hypothetical protein
MASAFEQASIALAGTTRTWQEETRRRLLVAQGDTPALQAIGTLDLWTRYLNAAGVRTGQSLADRIGAFAPDYPLEFAALLLPATAFALSGTAPGGTAGAPYSFTPTVTSGVAPITYNYTGGPLPAEFSFNTSTGAVTATTPVAGTTNITIVGVDAAGVQASLPITITIV